MSTVHVINAATNAHYIKGSRRLTASLSTFGVPYTIYDSHPTDGYDTGNPYTIKPSCFEHAVNTKAADIIIWMDSSAVMVSDIAPLVEHIACHGYYLASSGYNAAQTCTDDQLEAVRIADREEAQTIPDTATGCVGIDTRSVLGMRFLELWTVFAKSGLFNGNRMRDKKDSTHPLFLHARQDQAAATVIAHILKMPLENLGGLTCYWPPSPTAVIAYKGIQ